VAALEAYNRRAPRFWQEWNDFFENGITALDDGKKKEKAKPKDEKPEPLKCPACGTLHASDHRRLRGGDSGMTCSGRSCTS
jgi:hypothetical protein